MITAQYSITLQAGGVSIQRTLTREGDGAIGKAIDVPPAKALSTWSKSDFNTASGNLAAEHGWETGVFDVYWAGGARYDVAVTITANACALDGGSGDEFPDNGTAVVLAKQKSFNVLIDGDELHILGMSLEFVSDSAAVGRVLFETAAVSGDDIADIAMQANSPQVWDVDGGSANPFAGNVITAGKVSHSDTSLTAQLKITGLDDSTP